MSNISRLNERYRNDDAFRALVDQLRHVVETLQLSASEVREAAMFAVYMIEMRRPIIVRMEGDDRGDSGLAGLIRRKR